MERPPVVVIGAGTMGTTVAVDYLLAGYAVTLAGRHPSKLEVGAVKVQEGLDFLASENYLSPNQYQQARANFQTSLLSQTEIFKAAGIVVENITEELTLKQQLFASLEEVCPPDTLFFTNTSGLSVRAIFSKLQYPGRAMGTHYWNPAYLMPLVELTPAEHTDHARLEEVRLQLIAMGKTPVIVRKEAPGLIWNRLQFALLRECLHLLAEGIATAEEIDQVVEKGLARRASFAGLFRLADMGGGDVWYGIADYLFKELSTADKPPSVWKEMIERGEFGVKTGQGFYQWDAAAAAKLANARNKFLLSMLMEDRVNPGGEESHE